MVRESRLAEEEERADNFPVRYQLPLPSLF